MLPLQKTNFINVFKAFFLIVTLPFSLIWLVWRRSDWPKQKKLTASFFILLFCLFFIAGVFWLDKNIKKNYSSLPFSADKNSQLENFSGQNVNLPIEENTVPKDPENLNSSANPEIKGEKTENLEGEIYSVARVIDGDTLKLEDGRTVRYIGIDTPETVSPSKPVQCFGKEASDKNRELVEGKKVRLVKDVSETDKYGRLLRYVFVGDLFVNDYLVREGYAHAVTFPPDIKFSDQFKNAQKDARERKIGLWSDTACPK